MKRTCLISITLIFAIIGCQNKVKTSNIDVINPNPERVEFAKTVSDKILSSQSKGSYYVLSKDEADITMINSLNENVQKQSYKKIKNLFGDYKGLTFHSIKELTKGETYEIYRFKGDFEQNNNVEIRAVLNKAGKLAGFFVKPWMDKL